LKIIRVPVLILVLLCALGPTLSPGADSGFKAHFDRLCRQFEQLRDYQCLYESTSSKGERTENFLYKLFFSKPKSVRMEIVQGRSRGTILLLDPVRNKVRLRIGSGLLTSLVLTMSPDNKRVVDLNGHGIDHADWGWFLDQHRERLDYFDSSSLGEETIDGRMARVFELVSKDTVQTRSIGREKIWIDPEWDVIVRYQIFDPRGNLIQAGVFSRIVLNPGLDKNLFVKF
jgi:outer membrane lipoprotein-sorting protein